MMLLASAVSERVKTFFAVSCFKLSIKSIEALNETAFGKGLIARGKHYLIFGSQTSQQPTQQGRERLLQNRVLLPNWLFFDDVSSISYDDWSKKYTNIVSSPTRPIFIN